MADRAALYQRPAGDAMPPSWKAPPRPPHVTLKGKFVDVEPCVPALHAAPLFEAFGSAQPQLYYFIGYGPFESIAELAKWMTELAATQGSHTQIYVVRRLSDGAIVGLGTYLRIDPAAASLEIGHIVLSPQLQRTSEATEFFHLLMDNAFAVGYRRVEWKCNWSNKPSVKAALRLGFSFEGVFRQCRIDKGRNRDTAWFAVVDWEWPRIRAAHRQWLYAETHCGGPVSAKVPLSHLTQPLLQPLAKL